MGTGEAGSIPSWNNSVPGSLVYNSFKGLLACEVFAWQQLQPRSVSQQDLGGLQTVLVFLFLTIRDRMSPSWDAQTLLFGY